MALFLIAKKVVVKYPKIRTQGCVAMEESHSHIGSDAKEWPSGMSSIACFIQDVNFGVIQGGEVGTVLLESSEC